LEASTIRAEVYLDLICSENVTWFVLQQFAEMSQSQLQSFREMLGNDFRPAGGSLTFDNRIGGKMFSDPMFGS